MRKLSILKHKIIRAYHNPKNWEYSKLEGYPKNTYFGYDSCCDCKYCKIEQIDLFFARFYCKQLPFSKNLVTGEIDYIECSNELRAKCEKFKPNLFARIYNFFGL